MCQLTTFPLRKGRSFTKITSLLLAIVCIGCARTREFRDSPERISAVHDEFVFADTHAHPSRFHRADVPRIAMEELDRYRRGYIDLVVCAISSDAAYEGGYVKRDGTQVKRMRRGDYYELQPGEAFEFTLDRFARILKTVEDGDAILASSPSVVLDAKGQGRIAMMPALEGADGLESSLDNLRELYDRGLRLLQLLHFRDNELGCDQTAPYNDCGLTPFGLEVVRECNRLGIIIDLAHSNTRTTLDVVEASEHPVIFSHTGVKALYKGDRYLTDEEIRAIASTGGIVGIWPTSSFETMDVMVQHIDHVKNLVGIDHVGIGSDLRGMSYLEEFGEEAHFRAIAEGLASSGYSDEEIGKVMGGNFFRVWQEVSRN